jgi:hypothetical protein
MKNFNAKAQRRKDFGKRHSAKPELEQSCLPNFSFASLRLCAFALKNNIL